jgi:uncharacterized protein YbjT (DUF2867 family)
MIVITAPTGQIGQRILEHVIDGDEAVRVIARDASKLSPAISERVEIIEGSHGDGAVVTKAFDGADTVFWLVPPNPAAQSVEGYYLDFTRPAVEAIVSRGVERVIGVSSLGHDYTGKAGNLSAAFAMDDLIASTGVSYRSLRMPFFMENHLHQVQAIKNQGMFFMANTADRPLAMVATSDIAAAAAGLLLDRSWSGEADVPVVSPDDLSPDGMARVISEVLGRPVRYQQVSAADNTATMMRYGMSEAWARGIADMVTAQNDGIYDAEAATARRTSTGFRQWAENVLKPAVLS